MKKVKKATLKFTYNPYETDENLATMKDDYPIGAHLSLIGKIDILDEMYGVDPKFTIAKMKEYAKKK